MAKDKSPYYSHGNLREYAIEAGLEQTEIDSLNDDALLFRLQNMVHDARLINYGAEFYFDEFYDEAPQADSEMSSDNNQANQNSANNDDEFNFEECFNEDNQQYQQYQQQTTNTLRPRTSSNPIVISSINTTPTNNQNELASDRYQDPRQTFEELYNNNEDTRGLITAPQPIATISPITSIVYTHSPSSTSLLTQQLLAQQASTQSSSSSSNNTQDTQVSFTLNPLGLLTINTEDLFHTTSSNI